MTDHTIVVIQVVKTFFYSSSVYACHLNLFCFSYSCIHSLAHLCIYPVHTYRVPMCFSHIVVEERMGLRRWYTPRCSILSPSRPSTHLHPRQMKCPCSHERPTYPLCSASYPTHLSMDWALIIYPFSSLFVSISLFNSSFP